MAQRKAVEALQFEFVDAGEPTDDGAVEVSGVEEGPASRAEGATGVAERVERVERVGRPTPTAAGAPLFDRRSEGLRLAFAALEAGRPPSPSEASTYVAAAPQDLAEGSASDVALSISGFYERMRLALRVEFPGEVWVTGEIRKVNVSKGHRYIELADHTPDSPRNDRGPSLEVACWSRDWPTIAASLDAVGIELTAGLVVRIRGRVSVWDAGARIRFSMSDLDVEALVGGIAAARRKLLSALEAEGVLHANQQLSLPAVPLRVGLVTSAGSEAYRDFTGQLERSGYQFVTRLERSLVQGPGAPEQIAAALARLQLHPLDLIVVVRGGGAKGDLAAFDQEVVARAIVGSRYPVWTGIGHTGDRSVADEVAHRALVTPTAVGEAVVSQVSAFVDALDASATALLGAGRRAMDRAGTAVERSRSTVIRAAQHELTRAESSTSAARNRLARSATRVLANCDMTLARRADALTSVSRACLLGAEHTLEHRRTALGGFDPRRQLARGWSLTRRSDGTILRSVSDVEPGDQLTTFVADGTLLSKAISVASDLDTAVDATATHVVHEDERLASP